jgi:hypothetical protein
LGIGAQFDPPAGGGWRIFQVGSLGFGVFIGISVGGPLGGPREVDILGGGVD